MLGGDCCNRVACIRRSGGHNRISSERQVLAYVEEPLNTLETEQLLRELAPGDSAIHSEVGSRGDVAALTLNLIGQRGRSVLIESPGDWWFTLTTDGGYSAVHADLDLQPEAIREVLASYVKVGRAYLRQGGELRRSGWLRFPVLLIEEGPDRVTLSRPVTTHLASLIKR